jgi:hypothetical protein
VQTLGESQIYVVYNPLKKTPVKQKVTSSIYNTQPQIITAEYVETSLWNRVK